MKLVTYLQDGGERVGILSPDGAAVRPLPCVDMNALIEGGDLAGVAARAGDRKSTRLNSSHWS